MRLPRPVFGDLAAAVHAIMTLMILAAVSGAWAKELKMPPVDEAAKDPGFLAFRDALIEAVARRDTDYVVGHASPDIKLSFGGSYGRDTFRDRLQDSAEGEAYWMELDRVLRLGGVFTEHGDFCTPYISCLEVPGCTYPDCDPSDILFVVSGDAKAYAEADRASQVVAELSYDVLPILEFFSSWYKVKLPNGNSGYVSGPEVRMSVDYRAFFKKQTGAWLLDIFIAGD